MSTEMVQHISRVVLRSADGKAMEIREHSFPEPADQHALHASSDREALRAQERAAAERLVVPARLLQVSHSRPGRPGRPGRSGRLVHGAR